MNNQFMITKNIIETSLKQSHDITPTEKFILVTLSSYLGKNDNDTYTCYPSQARIARCVGCTRSTVNRTLQKFEDLKFIRSRWRVNAEGGNTSKLYTWIGIPDSQDTNESNEQINIEDNTTTPCTENNEGYLGTRREMILESPPINQPDWIDELEHEIENDSPF
ncbi:helix-turn-helix domain-containing protein [Aliivibrio fischeri]|uniref:helix-turn-helix domain-containing protein n=1 Tax=Aliivibrio fischeri TaxID=668 RepID=UPI0012DA515C|nr:helix-turn-helix domain-containing protein [Aliivibrio fischeri]MUJ28539.1 helix-turn-helix domain-containing protein [Aliivibrio fischeri]